MRAVLFLPVAAFVCGCQAPAPDKEPLIVRATDLARFYRDDPATASAAYGNQPVRLCLTNPVLRGSELHWHLAGHDNPAVVVCRFAAVPIVPGQVVWLTGVCRGRVEDGREREFTGYSFHVLVTDCRPSAPPTTPAP